jgi:hypothetical protein
MVHLRSSRHILAHLSVAGVLSLPLAALSAIPAQASPAPTTTSPTAQPSGWVHFPVGASLSNPTIVTRVGNPVAGGGCVFHSQGTGTVGNPARAEIEIALDPANCLAQWESGTLPASTTGTPTAGAGANSALATTQAGVLPSASDPNAYMENQWLDPFGIQVSAQQQSLSWTIGGNCITGYSQSTSWSWYWDGWYPLFRSNNLPGYNCDEAWSNSYSGFENDDFCAFNYTTTYFGWASGFIGDYLEGTNSGTYWWSTYDATGGNCTWLLHHGHVDA